MDKTLRTVLVYLSLIIGGIIGLYFYVHGTPKAEGADGDVLIAGVNRGIVIGGVSPVFLYTSPTLSGACVFGGWITNKAGSEVTVTLGHSTGQGENMYFRNLDDTSLSGNTIFIIFATGVSNTILTESGSTVVSGLTAIQVSGTTLDQVVRLIGSSVSTWEVHSTNSLSLRNQ